MLFFFPIILLIIINLFFSADFSPTWDFPMHLLAGQIRLGEVGIFSNKQYLFLYGIFADGIPLIFSRLFPSSWFPASYLLFGVLIGCIGVVFFYLLVKEAFGGKIASLSTITLLLLPRFVAHLHTNIKDVVAISFFIIAAYYFYQYLKQNKSINVLLSLISYTASINTKLTILQLYPLFIAWMVFHFKGSLGKKHLLFLSIYWFLPLIVWFMFWPGTINSLFASLWTFSQFYSLFFNHSGFYAIEQLIITTPLIILVFTPFGLYVLWKKIKKGDSLSFFFFILFFYTLLKYPVFGLPVIDDVRYFLEIYFPLSLGFILGVEFLARKYVSPLFTNYIYILFFVYFLLLNILYHPYQISFYNSLAGRKDPDFWAASYREVFADINRTAAANVVISARLAPELAEYLVRDDLKKNLNSRPPEESDIVVILNRPSFFRLFQVDNFYATHRPSKMITNRVGTPLSYIYFNH